MRMKSVCVLGILTLFQFDAVRGAEKVETKLAVAGTAAQPVVIGAKASVATRTAATELAAMLEKISGGKFEVKAGDGRTGIAVGTAADFPGLQLATEFDATDAWRREDYLLRSHAGGVYVIGATDLAVSHAVWDLLYRLGYRHFFPGDHWEIVPHQADLSISVDKKEHPDYVSRQIHYAFGDWKDLNQLPVWNKHNRMAEGLDIHAGHSYDRIYRDNKAEFERHPEYLCTPKKRNMKFRVSNPALRKLVVDWALDWFEKHPEAECISVDPSDGGGWENAEEEKVFKNVTDRVVTLANEVAAAVEKKYKNKYVGIYAYNYHSSPPTIRLHPKVVVFVATGYIKGGQTVEQLMAEWKKQGATILGMREYYSVTVSHKDRPGGPRASDPHAIAASILKFYQLGARTMNAESSNNWGPAGLGHYVASRLLWDVKTDPEAVFNDFFEKSFGPARAPMQEYYRLIDRANSPLLGRHLIGQMYRQLDAARQLTQEPGIRGRIDDLTLYTRYCELLWDLQEADKAKKAAASEATLRFVYRIRKTGMVHSLSLWRDTRGGFEPVPDEAGFRVPEGKNPWKSSEPVTTAEIDELLKRGIAANPVVEIQPVQFSDNLVPATTLKLSKSEAGTFNYVRHPISYYVWFENPGELKLEITAGQVSERKIPAVLNLFALEKSKTEAVATVDVPIDRKSHSIVLKSPSRGLHRLDVNDRGRGLELIWPEGTPVTMTSNVQHPLALFGRNDLCFYVPKGTMKVGGFAHRGIITDGQGSVLYQSTGPAYFNLAVPKGQDGQIWWLKGATGKCLLLTVPGQFARSSSELLLPKEVVEADAKSQVNSAGAPAK